MAFLPGSMNALPGVYGPTDYYFGWADSMIRIGWEGGIWLYKGNWVEAAIALRIEIPKAFVTCDNFCGWRHVEVDKNYDIHLRIIPEGTPYGPLERGWTHGKPVNEDVSRTNFPILKTHYDRIKNLKAFW